MLAQAQRHSSVRRGACSVHCNTISCMQHLQALISPLLFKDDFWAGSHDSDPTASSIQIAETADLITAQMAVAVQPRVRHGHACSSLHACWQLQGQWLADLLLPQQCTEVI